MDPIVWELPQPQTWERAGCKVYCKTYVSKRGAKNPYIKHVLFGHGNIPMTPSSFILLNDRFLTDSHASRMFQEMESSSDLFESPLITVHGKTVPIPRGQMALGEGVYSYSNIQVQAHEPPENTKLFLTEIQRLMGNDDAFKYILVNKYTSGTQKIGRHSDDEYGLTEGAPIISYSLGAPRRFVIRSKKCMYLTPKSMTQDTSRRNTVPSGAYPINGIFDPKVCPGIHDDRRVDLVNTVPYCKWTFEISANHNTLIAMCGRFQKEFVHEVPEEKKVKDVRYNLTIRANIQ